VGQVFLPRFFWGRKKRANRINRAYDYLMPAKKPIHRKKRSHKPASSVGPARPTAGQAIASKAQPIDDEAPMDFESVLPAMLPPRKKLRRDAR